MCILNHQEEEHKMFVRLTWWGECFFLGERRLQNALGNAVWLSLPTYWHLNLERVLGEKQQIISMWINVNRSLHSTGPSTTSTQDTLAINSSAGSSPAPTGQQAPTTAAGSHIPSPQCCPVQAIRLHLFLLDSFILFTQQILLIAFSVLGPRLGTEYMRDVRRGPSPLQRERNHFHATVIIATVSSSFFTII